MFLHLFFYLIIFHLFFYFQFQDLSFLPFLYTNLRLLFPAAGIPAAGGPDPADLLPSGHPGAAVLDPGVRVAGLAADRQRQSAETLFPGGIRITALYGPAAGRAVPLRFR